MKNNKELQAIFELRQRKNSEKKKKREEIIVAFTMGVVVAYALITLIIGFLSDDALLFLLNTVNTIK